MQTWPVAHAWPHDPQFEELVERFTQLVPQSVVPVGQVHVPALHVCVAPQV